MTEQQAEIRVIASFDGPDEVDFSIKLHPESSKQDMSNQLHMMAEKVRRALDLPDYEDGPNSELPKIAW